MLFSIILTDPVEIIENTKEFFKYGVTIDTYGYEEFEIPKAIREIYEKTRRDWD